MKQNLFYLLLLPMLFLSSCNSDDNNEADSRVAVEFTTDNILIKTNTAGDQWVANDKVGVFMTKAGQLLSAANIAESADNVEYKATASGVYTGFSTAAPVCYPRNGKVDFIAYYPYQSSFTTPYAYKVDVSDQSDASKIDILYSNNAKNKSKSSSAVSLAFDHMMSKIVLNIKAGVDISDSELTGVVATIKNMPGTANFNLADGSFDTHTTNSDIRTQVTATTQGYIATLEAIIIPQKADAFNGRTIVFEAQGKSYMYSMPDANSFESGKIYNYTIAIGKGEVTVSTNSINRWRVTNYNGSMVFYNVGEVYPHPYLGEAIGIVYETTDEGRSGKIVGLDCIESNWALDCDDIIIGVNDMNNGINNMKTIADYIKTNNLDKTTFPPFAWIYDLNDPDNLYNPDILYSNPDAKYIWYIPSYEELKVLSQVYTDFGKEKFDNLLKNAGGVEFKSDTHYWSSSEKDDERYHIWTYNFFTNVRWRGVKSNTNYTRCILAF